MDVIKEINNNSAMADFLEEIEMKLNQAEGWSDQDRQAMEKNYTYSFKITSS
jgi:hypothetical protein